MRQRKEYSPEYLNRLGHFHDCAVSVLADRRLLASFVRGCVREFEDMSTEELAACIGDVECRITRIDPKEQGTVNHERKRWEIRFDVEKPDDEPAVQFVFRYKGLYEPDSVMCEETPPKDIHADTKRVYVIEIRDVSEEGEPSEESEQQNNVHSGEVLPAFRVLHLVLDRKMPAEEKIRKFEECGVLLSPRSRVRLAEMETLMKEE